MQSVLRYTTDESLKRRLYNSIVQRSTSLPKIALFEDNFTKISRIGFKLNRRYSKIGARPCRRSRVTLAVSTQPPSLRTAGRSCPGRKTTQCGSGTWRRAHRCRRSRATLAVSTQSPSLLTADRSCPRRTTRQCGSGTRKQARRCRRSRATPALSPQSPSLRTVRW